MAMTSGKQGEINVTPLIDVLLVLLIIFMVILPTKSVGLASNIPAPPPPDNGAPPPPPRDIFIQVNKDHTLEMNTKPVQWTALDEQLRFAVARQPGAVLFLSADPSLEFEDVAKVLDAAHGAGVRQVAVTHLIAQDLKAQRTN
jgi:biopolymer transport protein TolR